MTIFHGQCHGSKVCSIGLIWRIDLHEVPGEIIHRNARNAFKWHIRGPALCEFIHGRHHKVLIEVPNDRQFTHGRPD